MSQQTSGRGSPADVPTTQVAREEARDVGRAATDAGRHVAGTAAEQARDVAREARAQARDLVGEARSQLREQAHHGQQKAVQGLRGLADELQEMAQRSSQSGPATEIARQAADRVRGIADWIGRREPGDLLEEVRGFARRRPGVFLLGAAAAGALAGRLTRGVAQVAGGESEQPTVTGIPSPRPSSDYPPPAAPPLPPEPPAVGAAGPHTPAPPPGTVPPPGPGPVPTGGPGPTSAPPPPPSGPGSRGSGSRRGARSAGKYADGVERGTGGRR